MDFFGAVAAFVIAVGILVTVHEFGHFWVARRLGVRVLRFSVGFGRPIWTRQGAGGTEYAIGILPLGGYVRMLDEQDGEIPEAERGQAFNRKPLWARSAIVLAGPAFNFLFAAFAWWLVFMLGSAGLRAVIGDVEPGSLAERAGLGRGDAVVAIEDREAKTWSAVVAATLGGALDRERIEVRWSGRDGGTGSGHLDLAGVSLDELASGNFFDTVGIEPAMPASRPVIGEVNAEEPAARAGMRPGDEVVRALGQPIRSWMEWVRFVRARPGVEFPVEVRRGGEIVTLALRPAAVESGGVTIGRIGAALHRDSRPGEDWYVTERSPPLEAANRAVARTWQITSLTVGLLWKMVRLELSSEHLSGPITIARYARDSASGGFTRFLEFLALVSVSLGILNLLPIPVLDGGHLLIHLAEAVKGGPLSARTMMLGHQAGLALLVGLMSLALYNDVMRLFS
jgi:regulator of sigma E protease